MAIRYLGIDMKIIMPVLIFVSFFHTNKTFVIPKMHSHSDKASEQKKSANGHDSQAKGANKSSVPFTDNRPETLAQRRLQHMADTSSPPFIQMQQPAQLLKFDRFQGFGILTNWFNSSEEDRILAQEARLKEFIREMQPYKDTPGGSGIESINQSFLNIEASTFAERDYENLANRLRALHARLDNISIALTRTVIGYENTHAGETANWVEAGYQGPKSRRLLDMVTEVYALLPAPFRTDDNKQVIKESIFGGLSRIPQIRENDVQNVHLEFGKKRVVMLRKNFKKMHDRIAGDWVALSHAMNLTGHLSLIHLTGSDYHNDGQSVCIIETTTGDKAVYKPRSVSPDQQLSGGNNSAFNDLNQTYNIGLHTTDYLSRTDNAGESYSYMQFLNKTTQLSDGQAQMYYRQMGKMIVASKLLGVTDLHQENIMTGPNGRPYIIDAETSFLPDVMLSDAWGATGIRDSLTQFEKLGKKTANFFYTPQDLLDWQADINNIGPTPSIGFITQKRNESIAAGGRYRANLRAGIDDVLQEVAGHRDAIINSIQLRAQQVQHVRIVPVDTLTFMGALNAYSTRHDTRQTTINTVLGEIRNDLQTKNYLLLGTFVNTVTDGLKADLANTDLPIFHYEPTVNRIFYKGVAIARHTHSINDAIRMNVTTISQAVVDDVLQDLNI